MNRQTLFIISSGFLTVSIAYAIRYGYGILLPEMLSPLGISKTEAGIIYASYFFAYTLFSPFLGRMSDRCNIRFLLTFFTAVLGLGAFLMAWASSVFTAALFFTIAGIGHAACWSPVMALVQRQVPDHRRGMALAFTTMGSAVGIAGWSLCLPLIVADSGWQYGWISMGIFGFCVAGMNCVLIRDTSDQKRINPGETLFISYRKLLKERILWIIGFSYLLTGFVVLVPFTFLTVYAREELGLSYAVSTGFIAVISICGMAGKLLLGILSDSLGRIRVMILCSLCMGAGCCGMAYGREPFFLYGCAALFGLGFGAVWPVYAAAAPDFFPKNISGSVIGLWTLFLGAGSIVSPVICGWTIDHSGSYTRAFLLGGVGSGLSVLCLLPGLKRLCPVSSPT
ncbi:MAG: MFS transporter [Desulfococcaceae bacterium]|jgi:MFS family permease|nr:MFS transporter [Desulfococcaceae bacterium]